MKVIGKATGEKLLLEATLDEAARLLGYHNEYAYKDKNRGYSIGPGDSINVDLIYEHVSHMKRIENKLIDAKAQLDIASAGLLLAHDRIHTAVAPEPQPAPNAETEKAVY